MSMKISATHELKLLLHSFLTGTYTYVQKVQHCNESFKTAAEGREAHAATGARQKVSKVQTHQSFQNHDVTNRRGRLFFFNGEKDLQVNNGTTY